MADIQGLLQSRLTTYDPELDVSSGSLVDTVIIQPIVKALQADALLTDSKEFLLQKFYEGFPDYPATDGDAITDILINAASLFFEAYRIELNRIKKAQSIVNYAEMSESELDALAANWLVYRRQGSLATGTVRVIVNRLASVSITRNILFTAKNGKTFSPVLSYIITLSDLSINALGNGQYYFDLDVIATTTGLNGNIGAFEISTSSGIPSVVSVYNEAGFIGGSDADTNDSLSTNRLMRSITERSLVTTRGISARLDSLSSAIRSSQVIGFGDDEMVRDRVNIVGNGDMLGQGIAYFEDNICIISGITRLASLSVGNYLVDNANNRIYNITDIMGKSEDPCFTNSGITLIVKTDTTATPAYCAYVVAFSKASVALSNEEFSEYAHIGGKTDVYLSVSDEVDVTTSLNLVKEDSDLSGIGITITNFSAKIDAILPVSDSFMDMYLIVTHSETFVAKIFAWDVVNGSTILYFDFDFGETLVLPSATWEICKTISVDLSESFTTIYPQSNSNAQLEVLFNIDDTRVRSNIDLTLSNVKNGDFIQIESGSYKGNYEISRISGRTIFLSSPPTETTNRLPAKIVRSKSAVPSPISYVNSVSVQNQPVPYSKALGLEVLHSGGASELSTGVGFVSGSFHYFIKQAMADGDSDFKTSLKVLSPTLIKEISDSELVHDITLEDGSCILSFKKNKLFGADFLLPNDLLVPSSNNIFIAMGNVTSTSKAVDYPVHAVEGDILQILDGENKGKYVIQRVYNIKIPLTTNNISRNADKNTTVKVARSYNETGNWRMVSVIRIYGEFPVNVYETFAEAYRVPFSKEISGSGGDTFIKRYFDNDYMLQVFTDQSSLIDQSVVGGRLKAALQQLQTSSGINVNSDTVSNIPMNTIRSALNLSATCNYTVGKASNAYGEIILNDSATCILPSYNYRPYTLSNIAALMSGQSVDKNYNKPIFDADYFGSKFIVKCGSSRSLLNGVDASDINTFLPGIGGDSVNVLVPTSNIVKSRFVDNIDTLRLDSISYSGIDINPKKDDELHVLHEMMLCNASMPVTHRQYVGYMPCISTLQNVPSGFLTAQQVLNAVSGLQNVINHRGHTPTNVYSEYVSGTGYTYIFYEVDEGLYTNSNYTTAVSIQGIQPLTFDAYYFSTEITTNKNGLALASGIANNNSIYVEKQFDSLEDNLDLSNITGKHLRIIGGVNTGVYNITGYDAQNRLIFLDKSLQQSTMPILNRGVCFYRGEDAGKLFLIGFPGTTTDSSGNITFSGLDTDYNSGVGMGITSRYLTSADSGKYITLYNYVKDDRLDGTLGGFGVIRQNIGCYKINSVASTTRNLLGATTVAYQTISADIPLISQILGADANENTFIGLFFAITDEPPIATQIIEEGLTTVSTLMAFQVYEPIPTKYKVAAISTDHSVAYISSHGYAGAPSSFGDPLFVKEGSSTYNYTYNTNNPLVFVRPGEVSVSLSNKLGQLYSGGVNLQSLGHDQEYNTYTNKVLKTSNEVISGYNISTNDASLSYSGNEKITLNIQPILNGVSVINQLADVSTTVSNAVSTSQGLVGNTDERVVCSDTLVKRMLPCFIGADISYVGGPTELDATDHLVKIISNTLSTRAISISTIVRELHKLGATRVVLPIKMYYIVEDLQRTRHYRVIEDVLSIDQDIRIDGSTRIMSRDVAPYNKSKLGSTIKLTRLVEISTIGKG